MRLYPRLTQEVTGQKLFTEKLLPCGNRLQSIPFQTIGKRDLLNSKRALLLLEYLLDRSHSRGSAIWTIDRGAIGVETRVYVLAAMMVDLKVVLMVDLLADLMDNLMVESLVETMVV